MELKNRNPLIICTCGKARSGKSLVSQYIYDYYVNKGYKVVFSPYTKYLKMYISTITGWDMSDKDKPRDLLQQLSSELIKGKLNKNDFFINRQLDDIDIYSYFFDIIIIPDVRFPNEIEILKEKYNRVVSIGVIRDNYDSELTDSQKKDITEVSLDNYDKYDYCIYNDNTDKLYSDTLEVINDLRKKDSYE